MAGSAEFVVQDWVAYIVGRQNTQRGLLASFMEREFGFFCQVAESGDDLPSSEFVGYRQLLLLRDCYGEDAVSILAYLDHFGDRLLVNDKIYMALVGLGPDLDIEAEMFRRGVRGVVNDDASPDLLIRFIQAVVAGELWFPRQLVSRCILESRGLTADDTENLSPTSILPATLTVREREVLMEIGMGSTNDQISDHLCISQHTVKSHVYRIFRKINVPNRLQAALWASKYLV